MGSVLQLLAAQGMVCDEDKKHKVDVKGAAAGSLCFRSVCFFSNRCELHTCPLKILLDPLHSSVLEIQW